MGYDVEYISISLRLKKDNGDRQKADEDARERLYQELYYLLDSDPDYRRIAHVV